MYKIFLCMNFGRFVLPLSVRSSVPTSDPFWPHLFVDRNLWEEDVVVGGLEKNKFGQRTREEIWAEFMSFEKCKHRGKDTAHPLTHTSSLIIISKIVSANLHAIYVFDFNLRNFIFILGINQ